MRITVIGLLGLMALSCAHGQVNSGKIYTDVSAPFQDRVKDLLSKMTLEEKVAQLEGNMTLPSIGQMTFPSIFTSDGLNETMVC